MFRRPPRGRLLSASCSAALWNNMKQARGADARAVCPLYAAHALRGHIPAYIPYKRSSGSYVCILYKHGARDPCNIAALNDFVETAPSRVHPAHVPPPASRATVIRLMQRCSME
ncbi:hypothetical protein ACJJTC_015879 [Scirpophaga incertulas]